MTAKPAHGGARKGAGRKHATDPRTVLYAFRVTPAERAKITALGGATWLRAAIDTATPPPIPRPADSAS